MGVQSDDIEIPGAIIDLIERDLEHRGFTPGPISPGDTALALAGIYAQEYVAEITFEDAEDGFAVYSASRHDDDWTVDLLLTRRK